MFNRPVKKIVKVSDDELRLTAGVAASSFFDNISKKYEDSLNQQSFCKFFLDSFNQVCCDKFGNSFLVKEVDP